MTDTYPVDEETLPQTPSATDGQLLYTVAMRGFNVLRYSDGQELWKERLKGKQTASPVYADGRVYVFDQDGNGTVFRPGRRYEHLATNRLDGGCMASPAISGRALFVRTRGHLYRIEARSEN